MRKAFTLAEVLIVMTLIGFLFTLMIPNLVQKQSSTKFIDKAILAQTTLKEAFDKAAEGNDNLYPQDWESVRLSNNKSEAIVKELAKKTSIISFCGNKLDGCFATTEYRTLNGKVTNILNDDMKPNMFRRDQREFILTKKVKSADGDFTKKPLRYVTADPKYSKTYFSLLESGAVVIKTNSTYCEGIITATDPLERPLCATILVDVNGASIPNTLGVDVFGFYLSGNDLIPMGFYGDEFSFNFNCLREDPNAEPDNGLACTAWAIMNKNMEYRKCQAGNRLRWTDAKRCDTQPKK